MRASRILILSGAFIAIAVIYLTVRGTAKAHPAMAQKVSRAPELNLVSSTVFAEDAPSVSKSKPVPTQVRGAPIITGGRPATGTNWNTRLSLPNAPASLPNPIGDQTGAAQRPLLDLKFSPPTDLLELK